MEPTVQHTTEEINDMLAQGVRHFRAQGSSWTVAGERAAHSFIESVGISHTSTDALALYAAFASTARGLHAQERGL